MSEVIYTLCALASSVCAVLLMRSWLRQRTSLLFWSSLCFIGLTVNSALLVIDLVITGPEIDLSILRAAVSAVAMAVLLFGLIWSSRRS
jgi:hypothetical protein